MRPLQKLAGARKGLTLNLLTGQAVTVDDDGFMSRSSHPGSSWSADKEEVEHNFASYVDRVYKANGPAFACVLVRMWVFAEARFQFQRLSGPKRGELWGDQSLKLLEIPWRNGTTGDLLCRMEQDASLAGNFYATPVKGGTRLRRLRPDWVTIISGILGDPDASPYELDADILGYIYAPRDGSGRPHDPVLLTPDRVVHHAPIPDPGAQWRGMSWMTPVINEITGDLAATRHKVKFFQNGATPSFVVKYDPGISPENFAKFVEFFEEQAQGVDNAYKVLHLGGGADPTSVGADMKQIDFKATQGAGETRIAAASGVGSIMARFSEGMQGSSLNTGNYQAAKRQVADTTMRPLWRSAAGALQKLTNCPSDCRLWYDTADISFLQEDRKDSAEIAFLEAQTIRHLGDGGYTAESIARAIKAGGDWDLLEHSGRYSVQLQPAGADTRTPAAPTPPDPGGNP